MKIKEGFLLRKVANEHVVMPVGQASTLLNGFIKLNSTSVVLWKLLEKGAEKAELTAALQDEYGIDAEQAREGVEAFLAPLLQVGCIE